MTRIIVADDGFPILLANVPGSGVSSVDANAAGGNPNHDTRSGKFGSGSKEDEGPSQAQANIDAVELGMRRDAVRDAAREFDQMTGADAQEFLAGRVRDMSKVDLQQFVNMVRQQRLDDLADILEQQMRTALSKGRGRRTVKVQAPRGYTRRVFAGLTDDEVVDVAIRMERRGFSEDEIRGSFLGRIKDPDRVAALEARYGERSEQFRI